MRALAVLTLAAATGLGGCAAIVPPVAPPLADAPMPPVQPMARKGQSGGLFNPQSAWVLTNDSRAFRSGDNDGRPLQRGKTPGDMLASSDPAASSGLKPGTRIFHDKFGYGRVTEVDGAKLTVNFEKAGVKKVVESFVKKV